MPRNLLLTAALLIGVGAAQVRPEPDVVIRSSAREVLLDVVVRDAHGRLVKNLKPEEVTVYEDGVRQNVRAFRLVAGSEVRKEDIEQMAEAQALATPAAERKAPRLPVNPLRTVNVVCLILNDLTPETRAFAFDAARKFVNNELRPNTFIGVFSVDSSGLRPVFPFSNNREHLLKAVELAAVNQLPAINLDSAAMLNGLGMSAFGSVTPVVGSDGTADGSSPQHPLGTRGEIGLAVNDGLREIDALKALVRDLSPLPFQKSVMMMTTGLTRPPDLLEYWDSLIRAANKAGVSFYAMDVYGLSPCQGDDSGDCGPAHSAMAPSIAMLQQAATLSQGQRTSGQIILPTTPTAGPGPSPTAQLMEMAHEDDIVKFAVSSSNRQEAIRELAERTGGFLIANTNNTDKLLARVMEDVDTHYEIAYPPTSASDDGHFRKIEVKLTRPGLTVQTRGGYFAVPDTGEGPVTPVEMAGLRALDTQPRPRAFDFLLRAYRFRETGRTAQYSIAFEMPISNLTATPEPVEHKYLLHATLLALVKNAQGQIVDRVSKDVPSEVSDDHLASVQAEIMTYQHAISLAPGRYSVEAAVVDQQGNRAATASVAIDNQERRGLALSDLTLVRRLEDLSRAPDAEDPFEFPGKRVLPFVSTDLLAGAIPVAYYVIYPDTGNPAKPQLRVRLLKNGRVVRRQSVELPAPDVSGAIPMVTKATADPGNYELRITAVQGRATAEQSLKYTVARKRADPRAVAAAGRRETALERASPTGSQP